MCPDRETLKEWTRKLKKRYLISRLLWILGYFYVLALTFLSISCEVHRVNKTLFVILSYRCQSWRQTGFVIVFAVTCYTLMVRMR